MLCLAFLLRLFHGLTTHIGSSNAAGSHQPRVAQFARYSHREMREQAGMVMFPDADGNAWTPPEQPPPPLHADNPNHVGNAPSAVDEQSIATGFLPLDDPGRSLVRYDVPEDLFKYWAPVMRQQQQQQQQLDSTGGSGDGTMTKKASL